MKIANAIHTSKAVSADAFSTGDEGQGFALCSILNDHFITTATIVTASTTHHYHFLLYEINNSNSSNSQVTIQHIQKVFMEVMNHSLMVILFMFFFQELSNHLQVSPSLMTFQLFQIWMPSNLKKNERHFLMPLFPRLLR